MTEATVPTEDFESVQLNPSGKKINLSEKAPAAESKHPFVQQIVFHVQEKLNGLLGTMEATVPMEDFEPAQLNPSGKKINRSGKAPAAESKLYRPFA